MKEVMKHQQPLMNQNMTLEQSNTKGLRPILPKPADDLLIASPFLNKGGVQILSDGSVNGLPGSIPVVILPTQIYMNMANKIAAGNMTAVGVSPTFLPMATEVQSTGNTGFALQVQESEELYQKSETSLSERTVTEEEIGSGCSTSVTQTLQENCKNNVANMTVEQALCKIENRENGNFSEDFTNSASTSSDKTCNSSCINDNNIESNEMFAPHAKKTKPDKRKTKPCSRIKTSTYLQRKQGLPQPKRSPLRPRPQLTLAAINSQANALSSPGYIFNRNNSSELNCLSPVKPMITPTKTCDNQSFLTSLLVSPLGYGSCGPLGFTPLKFGSDSGFFSPLKDGQMDYGFLFSPERFGSNKVCSTPQTCRKSLGLGLACKTEEKKADGYDADFTRL